jgi:hypothetical protein
MKQSRQPTTRGGQSGDRQATSVESSYGDEMGRAGVAELCAQRSYMARQDHIKLMEIAIDDEER